MIRPPGAQNASPAGSASSPTPAPRRQRGGTSFASVMADKSGARAADKDAPVGATVSGARAEMRRSHVDWNPAGIPLSGNRNSLLPRPAYLAGNRENSGFALKPGDFIRGKTSVKKTTEQPKGKTLSQNGEIGTLSARFESGGDGIAAIGYDGTGGTSYGKYQIASRVGGMTDFLKFLDREAPDMAGRLRKAGPADTGGRKGKMPEVWRDIAREEPERFERLQENFIRESHYQPALAAIVKRTRLMEDKISPVMREVIWSTAVQHGPAGAARLFDRADNMSGEETGPAYERKLINNVYALRSGQFGSSSREVQASVARRFVQEKMLALNMLDAGNATRALA